jgi:1-deoxy-D-xylulose-5-phosphate synthase
VQVQDEMTEMAFGTGEIRREMSRAAPPHGKRIAILAFGTLLYPALAAAERIDATVANMRFAKPLDVALVTDLARRHDAIVTVEEGTILGGAGSAVLEALAAARIEIPVLTLGLPDAFVEHGDPAKLLAQCGLDASGIEQSIQRRFGAAPALLRTAVGQ